MDQSVFILPLVLFCAVAVTVAGEASLESNPNPAVVSRIAFGSCRNQSAPQPIWDAIVSFEPQVFIWIGDNIYGDNRRPWRMFGVERTFGPWKNVDRFFPSSEQELRRRYEIGKNNPGYSRLRQRAEVIGTWDDHDYGLDNAGKEFPAKNMSQKLLLDFLDEPKDSPRRKQAGVYAAYSFGPEGKRVKVILLDARYHRDPIFSDGTMLGELQWKWLERELNGPRSELTIIASSIQVVSNLSALTNPLFMLECWGHFRKERLRLYELIKNSKRDGVFFISGDVHFGEINRFDCGAEYPIYDITASGLTQSIEMAVPPPVRLLIRFMAWLAPSTMRVYGNKCRYRSCTYGRPNFGAIDIDWDASPPTVKFEVRDTNGNPVTGVNVLLSDLKRGSLNKSSEVRRYKHYCTLEIDLPWILRYRLALLVASTGTVLAVAALLLAYAALSFGNKLVQKSKLD